MENSCNECKPIFCRTIDKQSVQILDQFNRVEIPQTPVLDAAKKDENLSAFLSFSPVYRWEVDEYDDSYEVRFIDLRYRSKDYYPFVAVVQLNTDLKIKTPTQVGFLAKKN